MDELNDLKALWLTAKTDSLPSSSELVQLVRKFRWQRLRKKIVLISSASALALVMVLIMFVYHSTMLSTRIGEVLLIAACALLVVTNTRSIKRFYDLKDCSNKEFLEFVEQTRLNMLYYYRKTQIAGLVLCSLGMLLYVYEFVYQHILITVIIYALIAAYLCFAWFVLRPRIFKKNMRKLNAVKEKLEQFSNN